MTTNTQKHDVNSFFVTMKWHSETDKGHINTHNPLSQQCIIRINHGALFEKKKLLQKRYKLYTYYKEYHSTMLQNDTSYN